MTRSSARRSRSPGARGLMFLALAAAVTPALAVDMQPGLWRIEMTSTNAFTGPRTMKQEQCVTEHSFDPAMMQQQLGDCSDVHVDDAGDRLDWTFSCTRDGSTGKGSGHVEIGDGSMTGSMKLVMTIDAAGGQQFVMNNSWTGHRVGPCP